MAANVKNCDVIHKLGDPRSLKSCLNRLHFLAKGDIKGNIWQRNYQCHGFLDMRAIRRLLHNSLFFSLPLWTLTLSKKRNFKSWVRSLIVPVSVEFKTTLDLNTWRTSQMTYRETIYKPSKMSENFKLLVWTSKDVQRGNYWSFLRKISSYVYEFN